MLKYQYNEAKKKEFLSFWGMGSIKGWETLQKNFSLIFLKITTLDLAIKNLLSHLIQQNFLEEGITIKEQLLSFKEKTYKINTTLLEGNSLLFEKLDTYNIITFTKSNPLKKDSSSEWQWEKWFATFLTNFPFFKTSQEVFSFLSEQKTLAKVTNLTIEEKNILAVIFDDVFLENNHFLESKIKVALNSLYEKKIIAYLFLQTKESFTCKITINPLFLKSSQANFLFKGISLQNKTSVISLPQALIYLDQSLFEAETKAKLNLLDNSLKENQINFLDNALLHLKKNQQDKKKYLQFSYQEKVLFLIKLTLHDYFFLLEILINLENPTFTNEKEFLFFIKKTLYVNSSQKNYPKDFSWLAGFFYLGIVNKKNNTIVINKNFKKLFQQKDKEIFPAKPALIIDIDMSITVFKEDLNEELDYYLNIFCQRKSHTYSISFEIDQKFSAFAWFLNFDYQKMIKLFEKHQKEELAKEFREYLKLFFEGCDYYREEKYHAFKIASTFHYNQFKFYLTKKKLDSKVIFDDKKKIVIFFSSQDYENLLIENQKEKKIKFF